MTYDAQIASARRVADAALAHLRSLLLLAVVERDGPLCAYCRVETVVNPPPARHFLMRTIDHVIPLAKGGRDDESNCVVACLVCNARKGARPVREFSVLR